MIEFKNDKIHENRFCYCLRMYYVERRKTNNDGPYTLY